MRRVSTKLGGRATWLLLLALAAYRIAYLALYARVLPFADAPIGDAEIYDGIARAMADGDWLDPSYSYRPFLYPLALGALYAAVGPSPWVAYALQAAGGLTTVALVAFIGARLWGRGVGLGAALLCGLYGPLVAAESKVLDASLGTLLHVASIAACVGARRLGGWAGAGALLGLAALARPPLWLFAICGLAWAWRRAGRRSALVAAGALAGVVLPLCAWNLAASGSFTPLSRNGGATFLHGNNPRARGDYAVPPGQSGEAARQEAEAEAALAQALGWIGDHPGDFVRLLVLKLYRFSLADEAPLDYDFAFERERVPWLHALPVPFSLLCAFGLLGLALSRGRGVGLCGASLAVHVATALVFYVASRYRMPAAPALALLAAAGVAALRERWRTGARTRAAALGALAALAAASLAVSPFADEPERRATALFNEGYAHERRGDPAAAEDRYRAAVEALPGMTEAWLHLGNLAARAGRIDLARARYERALASRPGDVRVLANLALVHLAASPPDAGRAKVLLERAVSLSGGDADLHFKLGNALRAGGDAAGAAAAFERAVALNPSLGAAWNNLATARWTLAVRQRRPEGFREALEALEQALLWGAAEAGRNLTAFAKALDRKAR